MSVLPFPFAAGQRLIDPCQIPVAPCVIVRPLEDREDIDLGNAKLLCAGQHDVIVFAQNPNATNAEPIDVVLTSRDDAPTTIDGFTTVGVSPDAFIWPHVRALVEWGVGAQRFFAWVDVLTATHFSLSAEVIRVTAFYDVVCCGDFGRCPPPAIIVGGALGYGCGKAPQFTELACIEKPGDRACVPVPPFARKFHVMPARGGKFDARVVPFGGALAVDVDDPAPNKDIPLFNGARQVEIVNRNEAGALQAFVVFDLSL